MHRQRRPQGLRFVLCLSAWFAAAAGSGAPPATPSPVVQVASALERFRDAKQSGEPVLIKRLALAAIVRLAAAPPQRIAGSNESPQSVLRELCSPLRFLWYARNEGCAGHDFAAGRGHFFGWALGCYMSEARLMDRILIYEEKKCCHENHNNGVLPRHLCPWNGLIDEERFRQFPAVTEHEFLVTCGTLTSMYGGATPPAPLFGAMANVDVLDISIGNRAAVESDAMLVRRLDWGGVGIYWANVCDLKDSTDHVAVTRYTNASSFITNSKAAVSLGGIIATKYKDTLLRPPLITVHARRGDKVAQRERWPRNDQCTSPGRIHAVLQERNVSSNTTVYIASNEYDPAFFLHPPLSSTYVVLTWHQIPELVALSATKPYSMYTVEKQFMDRVRTAGHIETFGDKELNPFDAYDGLGAAESAALAPSIDYDHMALACVGGKNPARVKLQRHPTVPPVESMSPRGQAEWRRVRQAYTKWCASSDGQCSAMGCRYPVGRTRMIVEVVAASALVLAGFVALVVCTRMHWWRNAKKAATPKPPPEKYTYSKVPLQLISKDMN